MSNGEEHRDPSREAWEERPEWPPLFRLVEATVSLHASRHPGVITEAVVEAVTGRYGLKPRETWHRERRRNHTERIRRLSHSNFRILESSEMTAPVKRITTDVLRAFILTPRAGEGDG